MIITDSEKLKAGMKFVWKGDNTDTWSFWTVGDLGEIEHIDSFRWGSIKNLTTGKSQHWNYCQDMGCMEWGEPEPLVFKPFRSLCFVSGSTVYRHEGD